MKTKLLLAGALALAFAFAAAPRPAAAKTKDEVCTDKCNSKRYACNRKCEGPGFRGCTGACDRKFDACHEECMAGKEGFMPCATADGGGASAAWALAPVVGAGLLVRRRAVARLRPPVGAGRAE